jgi:hypothetical protein
VEQPVPSQRAVVLWPLMMMFPCRLSSSAPRTPDAVCVLTLLEETRVPYCVWWVYLCTTKARRHLSLVHVLCALRTLQAVLT